MRRVGHSHHRRDDVEMISSASKSIKARVAEAERIERRDKETAAHAEIARSLADLKAPDGIAPLVSRLVAQAVMMKKKPSEQRQARFTELEKMLRDKVVKGPEEGYVVLCREYLEHRSGTHYSIVTCDENPVRSMSISPDGRILAVATSGRLELRDSANGKTIGEYIGADSCMIHHAAFSHTWREIVVHGHGLLDVLDVASLKPIEHMRLEDTRMVTAAHFVPQSHQVLYTDDSGTIVAYDTRTIGRLCLLDRKRSELERVPWHWTRKRSSSPISDPH